MKGVAILAALGLVIGGTGCLCLSLAYIHRLIDQLPAGHLKQRWHTFRIALLLFFLGFLAYLLTFGNLSQGLSAFIAPAFFFLGAVFVLISAKLALQTAAGLKAADDAIDGVIDPLTGTYSRLHLDHSLAQEYYRARRYWLPLSIIMLDIDHLEKVNTIHGLKGGDQVLAHFGRQIHQRVRKIDMVARYAEDKFVIITPHTRLMDAQYLAERLRLEVEATPIVLSETDADVDTLHISVSIGVAALFEGVKDAASLIGMTQDALAVAKGFGGNQVVNCDDKRCRNAGATLN